jgi:hypothetical protein
MAEIVYKSLSSLSPIELKYEYNRDEALQARTTTYQDGFSFYELEGLKNFQDVAINRDSVLVLTSAVNLSTVFVPTEEIKLGKLPGTFQLQPRNSTIYYVKHRPSTNSLVQTLTSASTFYIQPISNTNEVELLVDNKYLQVEAEYPYKAYLNERTLDPEEIYRQRFEVVYDNGFISIKTKTDSGYRYLTFNNDNVLRAIGLILNNTIINDYIFKCISISQPTLNRGFTPANSWTTYYFDIEEETNNKTVVINKTIENTPTNLLIDFPLEKAAETGSVNINIANLKTSLTPAGGPAPVENSYEKIVTTSN